LSPLSLSQLLREPLDMAGPNPLADLSASLLDETSSAILSLPLPCATCTARPFTRAQADTAARGRAAQPSRPSSLDSRSGDLRSRARHVDLKDWEWHAGRAVR